MPQAPKSELGEFNFPERIMLTTAPDRTNYLTVAYRTGGKINRRCSAIYIAYPPELNNLLFQAYNQFAVLYRVPGNQAYLDIQAIVLEEGKIPSAVYVGIKRGADKNPSSLTKVRVKRGSTEIEITETDLTDPSKISDADRRIMAAIAA